MPTDGPLVLLKEVRTEELLELEDDELEDDDPEYLLEYLVPGLSVLISKYSLHEGRDPLELPDPCGTPKFTGLRVVVVPPPSTLPIKRFLLPKVGVCSGVISVSVEP